MNPNGQILIDVRRQGAKEGQPLDFSDDSPPTLHIKVTDVNSREHLASVVSWLSCLSGRLVNIARGPRFARKAGSVVRLTTPSSKIYARSSAERNLRMVVQRVMH